MDGYGGSTGSHSDDTAANTDEDDDDNEYFYGGFDFTDTTPGATMATVTPAQAAAEQAQPPQRDFQGPVAQVKQHQQQVKTQTPGTSSPVAAPPKANNTAKAAELRAKLLAKQKERITSPAMQLTTSSSTPATPSQQAAQLKPSTPQPTTSTPLQNSTDASKIRDDNIDRLIADGQAAAAATAKEKSKAQAQAGKPAPTRAVHDGQDNPDEQKATTSPVGKGRAPTYQQLGGPTAVPQSTQAQPTQEQGNGTMTVSLQDPYYDDLPLWLDITGYHNVEFRNAKLSASKQRKKEVEDLEKEAARIAERLAALRGAENTDLESLGRSVAPGPGRAMAPPQLPPVMTIERTNHRQAPNGMKRSPSPDAPRPSKVSRIDTPGSLDHPAGYRTHGNNDDPNQHSAAVAAPSGPSAKRRSPSPSLRDRTAARTPARNPHRTSMNGDYHQTEKYYPSQEATARLGEFNSKSGPRGGRRDTYGGNMREEQRGRQVQDYGSLSTNAYRPHGTTRFFIIKSWNGSNVDTAQRDGLWATQEKNEAVLREAYETSNAVILLFSVNKSMAFQGYAQMTSPPDPSLPKPPFCRKLNWKTSPAFTLRWYAKFPVHFRMVGHLKNELNLDEHGQPMAVLIGKDGQEVDENAGRGVCEILDEAELEMGR